jgi:hypothetical protein
MCRINFWRKKERRRRRIIKQHYKKIGIGWTNFSAVAMETKKGALKKLFDSFHQSS